MTWRDLVPSSAKWVIGVDEVGLGCIAGPLVVCSVCVPPYWDHPGLKDSKKLSAKARERLSRELIVERRVVYCVRYTASFTIDRMGVARALSTTTTSAAEGVTVMGLNLDKYLVILDGVHLLENSDLKSMCLPKADSKIPAVMAASIIAKVHRDATMLELHKMFPQYGWDKSKGYPTPAHLDALKEHGISEQHRRSYGPVRDLIEKKP